MRCHERGWNGVEFSRGTARAAVCKRILRYAEPCKLALLCDAARKGFQAKPPHRWFGVVSIAGNPSALIAHYSRVYATVLPCLLLASVKRTFSMCSPNFCAFLSPNSTDKISDMKALFVRTWKLLLTLYTNPRHYSVHDSVDTSVHV